MTPHERHQQETARALGYTGDDAVACMNAQHDAYHLALSRMLGRDFSPTLRWVETGRLAHPLRVRHEDAVGWEERLVLDVQEWMNTGRFGGTMRALWWWGLDPETVRARLQNVGGGANDAEDHQSVSAGLSGQPPGVRCGRARG